MEPPRLARSVEFLWTGSVLAVLVTASAWIGLDVWSITLSFGTTTVSMMFYEGAITVVEFIAFFCVTGGLLLGDLVFDRDRIDPCHTGPPVLAVIPAYREPDTLATSVDSLLASTYERLSILVVLEPGDRTTRDRARALSAAHDRVAYHINSNPGSKAAAINDAVHRADADYIGVFDADERVDPACISFAMGVLRDGTDIYQARRMSRPTGPIETVAYCERVVVEAAYRLLRNRSVPELGQFLDDLLPAGFRVRGRLPGRPDGGHRRRPRLPHQRDRRPRRPIVHQHCRGATHVG